MLIGNFARFGLLAALRGLDLFGGPTLRIELSPGRRRSSIPTVHRFPRGKLYRPNGKREVARRLRQIEAGQLRVSP